MRCYQGDRFDRGLGRGIGRYDLDSADREFLGQDLFLKREKPRMRR